MDNLVKKGEGLELGNVRLVYTGATQNYISEYTYTATEKCIVFINATSTGSGSIATTRSSTGTILLSTDSSTSKGHTGNLIAILEVGQTASVSYGQNNWTTTVSCSRIVIE